MPSDADLARSISELKDEFRSGLSSLKRELAQEHDAALKKLKTATASVPKFKKKGNEKQFLLNSEVLEHVRSASTALQASSPQVEKALEELKEGSNFSNPFGAVNWPKAHRGSRVGSCFACGSFGHFRNQCPSFRRSFQPANLGNVLDGLGCWCTRRGHR